MEGARDFLKPSAVQLVYHHAPCDDGEAAAALFWQSFPHIVFRGLHPKDKLLTDETRALVRGQCVVLVDVCWGEAEMRELCGLAAKVLVLDHHVTSQQTMQTLQLPNLHCVFVMGEAGVSLAWRYLGGTAQNLYDAFRYIGLRDVWRHKQCTDAVHFCAAFVKPKRWEDWVPYMSSSKATDALIKRGRVIYEYQQQQLRVMAQKVVYKEWRNDGLRLAIVNVPYPWISEMGELLCEQEPERTVAVIWNKSVGEPFSVSLRSHDELGPDVTIIAKEFGGGGHAHAAAFRLALLPEAVLLGQ